MPGAKELLASKRIWKKTQPKFNLWGPGKNTGIRELKTIVALPPKVQRSIRLATIASTKNAPNLHQEHHIYIVFATDRAKVPALFVVTGTVSAVNYTITKAIAVTPWGKRLGTKTFVGD